MNSPARQVLLADKTENFAIDDETTCVEQGAMKEEWQTERDNHAARLGEQLLEHVERHLLRAGGVEGVFAAVARDTEFGEAEDADAGFAGGPNRAADARAVAMPDQG